MKLKESEVIPKLIASLSVHLSLSERPIRFRSIFQEIYGKTKLGESIDDVRIEVSGEMSVFKNMNPDEVKTRIQDSLKLYNQLDPKISSFLHAALVENDRFKQFLNFFFVLEIYTNQVFKKIDYKKHVIKVNNIPNRIKASGENFFLEQQAGSKTLSQRFH